MLCLQLAHLRSNDEALSVNMWKEEAVLVCSANHVRVSGGHLSVALSKSARRESRSKRAAFLIELLL